MVNEDNDKDTNGKDNDNLIFDTTTNLCSDAFLVRRGGDLTMMTTTTATTKTTTVNKDNDEDTNGNDGKDNNNLIF